MTTRWAYRCSDAGVSLERTRDILQKFDFCWRSVYAHADPTATGMPPLIANVGKVRITHDLLIYYTTNDSSELLGAFEVTTPPLKLSDDRIGAVGIADDAALVAALEGYGRDPFLEAYTGFFLARLKYWVAPTPPPTFGRNSIVPLN